ncbi:hypothetical protein [Nocardia africana]|uniref:DUF3558 domain-containing protein n=1 Tax=Nocardia africana TaxID=134964 RepID=A0ABW6NB44_9NOCA
MREKKLLLASALTAVFALTAACSSDSTDSPAVGPSPHIDAHSLDTGSFKTTPGKLGSPNPARARIVEGQRLGSVAPLAVEVDSRFKYQAGHEDNSTYAWIDPSIAGIRSDHFDEDAKGFTAGFYTWGRSEQDLGIAQSISYSVLLFSDDDSASHASRALYERELEVQRNLKFSGDTYPRGPVAISEHPDILAWTTYDGRLESYKTAGRFVIRTSVSDSLKRELHKIDIDELMALTTKSMSTISSEIVKFTPTPTDNLASVPVDHDDILGRTLQRSPGDTWTDPPGFYDRHGSLHLSQNPDTDTKLFAETGMDWMGNNGARLYRAKDAATAQKIFEAHSRFGKAYSLINSPKNLPVAKCYEYHADEYGKFRYQCLVRYNNYVAEVSSNQLIDIHQRISAQYAILENSE